MDIGSLLQEKLGSSKSEKEDHEKSESSAIDKFIDALAKNDRESAKAAFNHAVYEHMMDMEDEDEEDSDEDEEGLLIAMSPNKGVHSERSYKKPSRGKNFTEREKAMMGRSDSAGKNFTEMEKTMMGRRGSAGKNLTKMERRIIKSRGK